MNEIELDYVLKLNIKNQFSACLFNLFLQQRATNDARCYSAIVPLYNLYKFEYCRIRLIQNAVYVDIMDDQKLQDHFDNSKWKNTLTFKTKTGFDMKDRDTIISKTIDFLNENYSL